MNLTTLTRPWTALLAGLWLGLIGPGPALSPAIQAQTTAPAPARIEVAKLGPQIGEQVPDFSLVDQHGKTWTRQSILGPKGAMLVFFRSADWWPYCKTQLVELQGRLKELQAQGLTVAAISYDSREVLAAFAKQRGITFPLLSDAGSATITAYGLLNPAVEWGLGASKADPLVVEQVRTFVNAAGTASENQRGMAIPGTFILDRRGQVTARFFEEFYGERNTTELVRLRTGAAGSQVQGSKITTGQVEITTYPSDAQIAPGNRFSLVVDFVPRPGMHVYAPGAVGYRAVVLDVGPKPFVQLPPIRYPASETYFFKPLNERMPVYQKPFRLMQEVVLEGTRDAIASLQGKDTLTLTGLLDYQACDDKVCYNPVTVPVSWTVFLKPLIRERPIPAK